MSKLKKIPAFKTEKQEQAFWESHDSSEYVDLKQAKPVSIPNLKPSTKTTSINPTR
ncbi:MAG: CopG family antitoxin [Thiotrichales bacterium]